MTSINFKTLVPGEHVKTDQHQHASGVSRGCLLAGVKQLKDISISFTFVRIQLINNQY